MFLYIIAGILGVLNMVLWGLYGDLLVEKFSILKILRSVFIGILWSIFLFLINDMLPLFIVALVVVSLERVTTEIYKALLRVENQAKYKIPSDLSLKFSEKLKKMLGLLLLAVLGIAVYAGELPVSKVLIIGSVGIIIALFGALKDAPFEGFHPLKFFRSPMIAIGVGACLWALFPAITGKYLLLAIAGGERVISEFYKKILLGRMPGKFRIDKLDTYWKDRRKWLLSLYALNIGFLIYLLFV